MGAEAEEVEVRQLVLTRGGETVGMLAVTEDARRACVQALEAAGYRAEPPDDGPAEGDRITLGACGDSEERRGCDIATAVAVASEVADELGLPIRERLSGIVERGYTSEQEARATLTAWAAEVQSAPHADEDQRGWAEVVVSEVFGGEPDTRG